MIKKIALICAFAFVFSSMIFAQGYNRRYDDRYGYRNNGRGGYGYHHGGYNGGGYCGGRY